MGMDLVNQKENDEKSRKFPLEKYLNEIPSMKLSIDFSTLGKFPLSQDDLNKIQEIRTLVKSAEGEIKNLTIQPSATKEEVFHLEKPNYFDENFDQEKYIRNLVNAKFQGMKIVEHENAANKVQKIMMLKKALDKMHDEDSESSETITIQRTPKVYKVKMKSNKANTNLDATDIVPPNPNADTRAESVTINQDQSQNKVKKVFRSYHNKVIEIKSLENKSDNNLENITVKTQIPGLTVEVMPCINIRSQLMEQKIPSLDIFPTDKNNTQASRANNIALLNMEHEEFKDGGDEGLAQPKKEINKNIQVTSIIQDDCVGKMDLTDKDLMRTKKLPQKMKKEGLKDLMDKNKPRIDIIKESVSLTNRIDDKNYMFLNTKETGPRISEMLSSKISKLKKYGIPEIQQIYNPKVQIHRRCPTMFSKPVTSSKHLSNISRTPVFLKKETAYNYSYEKPGTSYTKSNYIPYSKLTLGGYKPEEIENILKLPPKSHLEFNTNDDSEKHIINDDASEELEDEVDQNYSESDGEEIQKPKLEISDEDPAEKYLDDFDVDSKSEASEDKSAKERRSVVNKQASLDFKSTIDVFDFVNYIETKDDSTQSSPVKNVSYRETQTSPEQESPGKHQKPARNNEASFKDKTFDINNITLADMLEIQKALSSLNLQTLSVNDVRSSKENKQQTSEDVDYESDNFLQKDTQTSPLRNKNVMTSPAKMIGQILSPIFNETKIDAETSPWEMEEQNDSNNSSFRQKGKQNNTARDQQPGTSKVVSPKKSILKESTDAYTDVSETSESYSLGEINLSILRRKSLIIKKGNKSNSSSTTLGLSSSSDLQFDSYLTSKKSEGEISDGQILKDVR